MGKKRHSSRPEAHKQALGEQIEDPETYGVRTHPRRKKAKQEGGSDDELVPGALTERILKEARVQQQEVDAAEGNGGGAGGDGAGVRGALAAATRGLAGAPADSDDDDSDGEGGAGWAAGAEAWAGEDFEAQVAAEDEAALRAFMAPASGAGAPRTRTLSDMIMERIREREAGGEGGAAALEGAEEGGDEDEDERFGGPALDGLDPKVEAVYRGVGAVLARYTTGRLPKAFKVIPNLRNWEEVLYLTDPERWSPHAVFQATRLFVSNLNARMAQRFVALVLLPAVRADVRANRRLHFALFQALKKATYKPGAFYKGFLLPLCAAGDCTLREAVIVTAVLRRASIPALHSAAAMLRVAELPYSGVSSFFLRVLLDKRYALPYRVIDALVDHFTRFRDEERALPVVWHQALLAFAQRYKGEIRAEDKRALRQLCARQAHHLVTPEVLRELDAAGARGEKKAAAAGAPGPGAGKAPRGDDPRALAPIIMEDD